MAKKKKPTLILTAKVDEEEHKINLLDLRIRERIALEEFMDAPYLVIQSEGWVISEKVLAFGAYLAIRRGDPTFVLEQVYDLMDEEKLSVTLGGEDEKPARPTRSRKTRGAKSSGSSSA